MQTYTLTFTLQVHDPATLRTHLLRQATRDTSIGVPSMLELLGSIELDLPLDVGCEAVDQYAMPCKEQASRPLVVKPRQLGAELERRVVRAQVEGTWRW